MGNKESKGKYNNVLKKILDRRKNNANVIKKQLKPNNYEITNKLLKNTPFNFINENINKFYEIKNEIIGKGKHGIVRLCNYNDLNFKKFIVKTIKISKFQENFKNIINEILIINFLDHPNIVNYYEAFLNDKSLNLIFEYLEGETLSRYIKKKVCLEEDEAKPLIYQILLLVNYCHNKGIFLRDLKLDNFIFVEKNSKNFKLIDFSKVLCNGKTNEFINLGAYTAPEILAEEYNEKVDFFSIGCIIYEMIFGVSPFIGDEENEIFQNILLKKIDINKKNIKISSELKYWIKNLLNKNENLRLNIVDTLNSSWFNDILYKIISIDTIELVQIFKNNLLKFRIKNKLTKILVQIIIKLFNNSVEIENILKYFSYLDYNNLGFLRNINIKLFMKEEEIYYDDNVYNKLLKNLNIKNNYYVTYSEFIVASISKKFIFEDKKIKFLFKKIKTYNFDEITSKNLEEFLKRHNFIFEDFEYQNLFLEYDVNDEGKINYHKFKENFINSFE